MITFADIDRFVDGSLVHVSDGYSAHLRSLFAKHTKARFKYYSFLYELVKARRPAVALEIGVEYGLASAHMCAASQSYDGLVIGIDHNKHHIPCNELTKLYNYEYLIADSAHAFDAVRMYVERYGRIGVVFQDSSHHYAPSMAEWKLYSQLLDRDAIWVCDDITPNFFEPGVDEKSMADYWNELPFTKKRYPELYAPGTQNCIGVMLCEH